MERGAARVRHAYAIRIDLGFSLEVELGIKRLGAGLASDRWPVESKSSVHSVNESAGRDIRSLRYSSFHLRRSLLQETGNCNQNKQFGPIVYIGRRLANKPHSGLLARCFVSLELMRHSLVRTIVLISPWILVRK